MGSVQRSLVRRLAPILAVASIAGCDFAPERERPSILLVSIDTLRADHVGLYGYERDTTPFLDDFARRCIVYDRAFSPCPWTLIAHMTMLTGLFPTQHGVLSSDLALSDGIPLLAERLRSAGYQTVGLYRESWIHPRYGFERGFRVFRAHEDAAEAGVHLRRSSRASTASARSSSSCTCSTCTTASRGRARSPTIPRRRPSRTRSCRRARTAAARSPRAPVGQGQPADARADPHARRALRRRYPPRRRELGEWFAALERDGWLANTLVIVTSDHGEVARAARAPRRPRRIRPGGPARALLLRQPGEQRAGTRVSEVVHLGDIVPTVLEVAGLDADPQLPGRSLSGSSTRSAWSPEPIRPTTTSCSGRRRSCAARTAAASPWTSSAIPASCACTPAIASASSSSSRPPSRPSQTFAPAREVGPMSEADREALRAIGYF
jgi:hypothetical protein